MLSGIGPILMRVRISFDALRLCALVAAGVTSGYLWRAAFESSSPKEVRAAAPPRGVRPPPAAAGRADPAGARHAGEACWDPACNESRGRASRSFGPDRADLG